MQFPLSLVSFFSGGFFFFTRSFLKKISGFHDKFFALGNFIFFILSSSILDLGGIKTASRNAGFMCFLVDEFRSISSQIGMEKGHNSVVIQETEGHVGQFWWSNLSKARCFVRL